MLLGHAPWAESVSTSGPGHSIHDGPDADDTSRTSQASSTTMHPTHPHHAYNSEYGFCALPSRAFLALSCLLLLGEVLGVVLCACAGLGGGTWYHCRLDGTTSACMFSQGQRVTRYRTLALVSNALVPTYKFAHGKRVEGCQRRADTSSPSRFQFLNRRDEADCYKCNIQACSIRALNPRAETIHRKETVKNLGVDASSSSLSCHKSGPRASSSILEGERRVM